MNSEEREVDECDELGNDDSDVSHVKVKTIPFKSTNWFEMQEDVSVTQIFLL